MQTFKLLNKHGYSLQFSPHNGNLLSIVCGGLYGSKGGGTLYLLEVSNNQNSVLNSVCEFEWSDGLFDLTWSKQNMELIATSSGDGTLQIWNVFHPEKKKPLMCLQEHTNEVYSVEWSSEWTTNQHILSASWDGSVKLWDPNRINSISSFSNQNLESIYCARFATFIPHIFSSVSINGDLKLWNSLDFSGKPVVTIHAHSGEILTCDWNKFHPYLLATGASDNIVRIWDIRCLKSSLFQYKGSEATIRRVKFSPFKSHVVAFAGYDFTARMWDFMENMNVMEAVNWHSDVINDISWNSKVYGQMADCGWDSVINVFTVNGPKDT